MTSARSSEQVPSNLTPHEGARFTTDTVPVCPRLERAVHQAHYSMTSSHTAISFSHYPTCISAPLGSLLLLQRLLQLALLLCLLLPAAPAARWAGGVGEGAHDCPGGGEEGGCESGVEARG